MPNAELNNFTTDTNMHVNLFANSDKLVDPEQRVHYDKDLYNRDDNDELDDDINKYKYEAVIIIFLL